jgi:hypothetical protein
MVIFDFLRSITDGWLMELYSGNTTIRPRTSLFATSRREDIDSLRVSAMQTFRCPAVVIMTIGATRMYRSLKNLGTTEV